MFEAGWNLHRIEKGAFPGTLLGEVKFPNSVCFINGRAFDRKLLKSVLLYACPTTFIIRGELVEDVSRGTRIRYFGSPVSFEMANSVETVREWAFVEGKLNGAIMIPRSVEVLTGLCFLSCESLHRMTIEAGSVLREIRKGAFINGTSKSFVIPAFLA
jgi:hypothetical protein